MNKKSTKLNKTYYFLYPGNINTKTGGYIYAKNILQRAKALNFNLKAIQLSENYPFQKKNDIKTLKNILDKLSDDSVLVFDGLVYETIDKVIDNLKKFKIIVLIHHPLYLEFKNKLSKYFFKQAMQLYPKANKIIVTSNETKNLITQKFKIDKQKIQIVEPGIEKLKKFKVKRDKNINLLTVGSIIERKNYQYLINELRFIDNVKLKIVGDTTRENECYNKLQKLISIYELEEKISFYSNVSTRLLSQLYSQCDFYISVSKYEGFGMALANALQQKKKIITFKTLTLMNTLKKDGIIYLNDFREKSLSKLILKNFKDNKITKKIRKNPRKFLTPIQSANLFIKEIKNA